MDRTHPPRCYAELCLWKVFVVTTQSDTWQIMDRWVRRYGNPFYEPEEESVEERLQRQWYQEALRFCYIRK